MSTTKYSEKGSSLNVAEHDANIQAIRDNEAKVNFLGANQYSAAKVYDTKALLPAVGELLTSYKVSNDATTANNGYYHWSGTVYIKDADLVENKIKPWAAIPYLQDSQVNHLGKDWVSNAATLSTDVPGTSSKWVERLSGYAKSTDINRHTIGDILFTPTALSIVGFYNVSTDVIETSTGYFHTGWLDWDGTETKIRYDGGLIGNVGIVCADANLTPILKMGGMSVNPQYTSDLFREFYIPKGTKKILFSCTSEKKSVFSVSVLENTSSVEQFKKEFNYTNTEVVATKQKLNIHNLGDVLYKSTALSIVGFYDVSTETISTSTGYFHTGWLDWDGTETKIRYDGGLIGNVGIVCADANLTPILKMGGMSVNPQYTSDLFREFYIPKGTKKILFSCTSEKKSVFSVSVLENTSSVEQFKKEFNYVRTDIFSNKKGGIISLQANLLYEGFFSAVDLVTNTTTGYKNTGWLDWDGSEVLIDYKGSLFGACGIGFKDENNNFLHVEGGKANFPQYSSDNNRLIKIPKGTRKMIFSCKADGYSIFYVKVNSDALKTNDKHPILLNYNNSSNLLPISLGELFHLRFEVNFEDLNKDFVSSKFATICGFDVASINGKPTTYETRGTNPYFNINYPVVKLKSGVTASGQNQIPDWKSEKFVGDIQFSIKYIGAFVGMEDLYVIFDGTTLTIGRDSTGVIYTYTCNSTTKVQDLIANMKTNLADFEVIDLLKTSLTSELLTFEKVYLVSKFYADSAGTVSRLDAFKFNFRKSKCEKYFSFDVVRIGQRLIFFQGGNAFFTGTPLNNAIEFFATNNTIKNIEIINNSIGDVEILSGNRLVSKTNPIVLTFMLHAVYKCREIDGGNLDAVYPELRPWSGGLVPVSIERLDKILATAKAKGYKVVTAEQIDQWKNGKIQLPKRSLCVLHDDREQYIYTDNDIAAIYESNNAKGSVCLIADTYDYGNAPQRMRADGWSAVSHFAIHQTLDTFPSSTLYDLCKQSIINSTTIGTYGKSLVYPGGGYNPVVIEALESAGYTSAWITVGAYALKVDSKFALKRIDASDSTLWNTIKSYFI